MKLREWLDSPEHREVCIGPDESMACCLDLMDDETKDSLDIEIVEPDRWEHPAVLRAKTT